MVVSKEILPLPLPFPAAAGEPVWHPSRWTRRRLRATQSSQGWANDCVAAINQLAGCADTPVLPPSRAQSIVLERVATSVKVLGKPQIVSPAGAFRELCGQKAPYVTLDGGPTPYQRELLSLPEISSPLSLSPLVVFLRILLICWMVIVPICCAPHKKPPMCLYMRDAQNHMWMPHFEAPASMPNF